MNQQLKDRINYYKDYSIRLRRYFHRHPELSSHEYQTARYIKEELIKDRLELVQLTETAFIAILDTGRPGPTLALRTELDGLPIEESPNNLSRQRVVQSENKACMHACGHDGHLAILLTTMEILIELKEKLSGRIVFIFEEGEETAASIKTLINKLKDYQLDAIYGNHLYSGLETGQAVIQAGPVMSGAGRINMTIHGKSGHASRPDQAINPIFAGASILNALSIAWNNQRDILETVTLGITQFNSGQVWNVIEESAQIAGTIRFFDMQAAEEAIQLIKSIARQVGQAHQVELEFGSEMDALFPPTINDSNLSQLVQSSADKIPLDLELVDEKWFASETFSEYRKLCPSHFTLIGTKNDQVGSGAAHHNECFDLDEESLSYGIWLMSQFAVDYLREGA